MKNSTLKKEPTMLPIREFAKKYGIPIRTAHSRFDSGVLKGTVKKYPVISQREMKIKLVNEDLYLSKIKGKSSK